MLSVRRSMCSGQEIVNVATRLEGNFPVKLLRKYGWNYSESRFFYVEICANTAYFNTGMNMRLSGLI